MTTTADGQEARAFLWGPVKQALINDLREHGSDIARQLCYTDQQRVKEMMVAVLTDYGRDDPGAVETLVKTLVPLAPRASSVRAVWDQMHQAPADLPEAERNARKTAIEVAGNLGIDQVLRVAALQSDPTTRATAVRYSYHLWQRDRETGFRLLEQIAEDTMRSVVPNPAGFEAVLVLSLVIYFDQVLDPAITGHLQRLWQSILEKLLRLDPHAGPLPRLVNGMRRRLIFSLVVSVLFRLVKDVHPSNTANYADLQAFFDGPAEERALYLRLLQYFDVRGNYSRVELEADLLRVLPVRNYLVEGIAEVACAVQAMHDPAGFLPFLRRFLALAMQDPVPTPYVGFVPYVVDHALQLHPGDEELFDFFVYGAEVTQAYYTQHPTIPGYHRRIFGPAAAYLGPYIFFQHLRTGSAQTDWLKSRIYAALARQDEGFFEYVITAELPIVALERRRPGAALDALALFFPSHQPQIDQCVLRLLARLRLEYPDEVDDFLDQQNVPAEMRLDVQTNEPVEAAGELIGLRSVTVLHHLIADSPGLRADVTRIFALAADCKDLRAWMDQGLRMLVALVYGQAIKQTRL